jgi:hypothetical protein
LEAWAITAAGRAAAVITRSVGAAFAFGAWATGAALITLLETGAITAALVTATLRPVGRSTFCRRIPVALTLGLGL